MTHFNNYTAFNYTDTFLKFIYNTVHIIKCTYVVSVYISAPT